MTDKKLEPILQSFDSCEEADQANFDYYLSLTCNQRLEIGLEIMQPYYEANPRLERVLRTSELGECPVSSDWRMGLQSLRRA